MTLGPGSPHPMGVTAAGDGLNIAVFSAHAERVDFCVFDGETETVHTLPERTGDIWHGHLPGHGAGTEYGLRAHGPWDPKAGHRFNPAKLLIDPYARALTAQPTAHDATLGGIDRPDPTDSAPHVPRAIVTEEVRYDGSPPRTPFAETIFYEGHVKGLTQRHPSITARGTFAGLGEPAMLDHLTTLGITAVELLPIHAFITDRFLVDRGLTNYWGYQSIGFFAPHPPYGSGDELRRTVAALHGAGIEVILDVVYNHTGEGDAAGPTLSFRGLDNASYYALTEDGGYINDTGTGNMVACQHPAVVRLICDSLRHWVLSYGIDGFRFDLGTVLGRGSTGFAPDAPLLTAIRQDPVLARAKMIFEPWDIGPGGYQVGAFPAPFAEWNDGARDDIRRIWRGDPGHVAALAARLTGSAAQFDHSGRRPWSSVNAVTTHDGMTLTDLVTYAKRHNQANGEQGRDGHGENWSDNMGTEGPDPALAAARFKRRANMMATLLFSQGVPLILAGDEIGRTQGGNNNAYAQDNETSWLDWEGADEAFRDLTAKLIALRKRFPQLRQPHWLHGEDTGEGRNLVWRRPDGVEMAEGDWAEATALCAQLRDAREGGAAVLVCFNLGDAVDLTLPHGPWTLQFSTDDDASPERLPAASVTLFAEG
ncbi:MAG: glycogen debranching protein GlgX [Shimia sp.]